MKYIDEFRNEELFLSWVKKIKEKKNKKLRIMEFCGGHTHVLHKYGIAQALENDIEFIHGPGCPVCVLPVERLEYAMDIAQNNILYTYHDLMRVPSSQGKSLFTAKAQGARIERLLSPFEIIEKAQKEPLENHVFFAIGFETTAPATALLLEELEKKKIKNVKIVCNHVLTPPAIHALLSTQKNLDLQGILGPAHVSCVIGSNAYSRVADTFHIPIVVSGFEPLDVLQSIYMIIENQKDIPRIQNQYSRSVKPEGNLKAIALLEKYFEVREIFSWRGLGMIPYSALKLRKEYEKYDYEAFFPWKTFEEKKTSCKCGEVLQGLLKPQECPLFGKKCLPETPQGACMVSSEGACAAVYLYG